MNEQNAQRINVEDLPESAVIRRVDPEVDIQVATAKTYPRSIARFRQQAMSMATMDEATAEGCFYAVPRAGKTIEGPSVRLAEICVSAWGNCRAETRVTHEDDQFVYAEAVTWDLETNVAIKVQTRRRITDKNGKKYGADMIGTTANAASSIALRNAILRIVPGVYVRAIYEESRRVAIGDVKTLAVKRANMMEHFGKMGVTPDRVLATIGKPSVDDIDLADLATLKGLATAIKDGDTNVDEAFPVTAPTVGPGGRIDLKTARPAAGKAPDAAPAPTPAQSDAPAAGTPQKPANGTTAAAAGEHPAAPGLPDPENDPDLPQNDPRVTIVEPAANDAAQLDLAGISALMDEPKPGAANATPPGNSLPIRAVPIPDAACVDLMSALVYASKFYAPGRSQSQRIKQLTAVRNRLFPGVSGDKLKPEQLRSILDNLRLSQDVK